MAFERPIPADKLILTIATIEVEARTFSESLTPAQWLWRPESGEWSMAQCLDHLNKAGYLTLPGIDAAIAKLKIESRRAPKKPPHQIVYGAFDRRFVTMMSPNPPRKLPVPKKFLPADQPAVESETLPQFFKLQERLQKCLEDSEGYDTLGISVASPVSPILRFSLAAWLEGLVGHERYHWLQAKAVRARRDFPK